MIFGDIGKHGHIRTKRINIIQLKRTYFGYIQWLWVHRDLSCERVADIAHHCAISAARLAHMIRECSRSGLAVAARYRNDLAIAFVAIREFYFADHGNTLCPDAFHQFVLFRYAGTLHHYCCIQYFICTVLCLFKFNLIQLQF